MSFWTSVWDAAESLATSATTPSKQSAGPGTEANLALSTNATQTQVPTEVAKSRTEEPLKAPLSPGAFCLCDLIFRLLVPLFR